MTATAAQISQIRRMVNEPLSMGGTYTDTLIQGFIERYPLPDLFGEESLEWTSGNPPTSTANTEWIATYDLNAAAADILEEKAAALMLKHDFSADGGNYARSQMYEMTMRMANKYRSRRSLKTIKQVKSPEELASNATNWIVNLADPE